MKLVSWVASAAVLIGGAAAQSGEASGTQAIEQERKIEADLQKDPDLKNNNIDVSVDGGIATLKGKVDSAAERAKAERIARAGGVASVENELKVGHQPAKATISDRTLTTKLQGRFAADDMLGRENISVTTTDGVVKLEGSVQSEEARLRALELARRSNGVKRVENNLQVIEGVPPIGTIPK
jgi:hyperosmotically inducible protein